MENKEKKFSVKKFLTLGLTALAISAGVGLANPQEAQAADLYQIAQMARGVSDVVGIGGQIVRTGQEMGIGGGQQNNGGYNNQGYNQPRANCVPGYSTSDCPGGYQQPGYGQPGYGQQQPQVQQKVMIDPETGERVIVTVQRPGGYNPQAVQQARQQPQRSVQDQIESARRTASGVSDITYRLDQVSRIFK